LATAACVLGPILGLVSVIIIAAVSTKIAY
jgi:hypothetical protein